MAKRNAFKVWAVGFDGKGVPISVQILSDPAPSLKCPVAAHWRCLARTQREEITRAACSRDNEERKAGHGEDFLDREPMPGILPDRKNLHIDQTTEFLCGLCMKGGMCMECGEVALEPDASVFRQPPIQGATVLKSDSTQPILAPEAGEHPTNISPPSDSTFNLSRELLFRCLSCKRLAHYKHLPTPHNELPPPSNAERALYYQVENGWQCADCASFVYPLDKILAWRPYPVDAVEPKSSPDIKTSLPREYLVKWAGRSYRRVQWVPHMWLVSTYFAKLKNFLATGPKVELLDELVADSEDMHVDPGPQAIVFEPGDDAFDIAQHKVKPAGSSPEPLKDAQLRIPPAWKTVDRILDVQLWHPPTGSKKGRSQRKLAMVSDVEEENPLRQGLQSQLDRAFEDGEQPDDALLESVDEWEARTKQKLNIKQINQVVWAFIKWDDLGYEEGMSSGCRGTANNYLDCYSNLGLAASSRRAWISRLRNCFVSLLAVSRCFCCEISQGYRETRKTSSRGLWSIRDRFTNRPAARFGPEQPAKVDEVPGS